jgi:predicted PurR-regulated permease PerM
MILTIIILAYVANMFLNRWLNKIIVKINRESSIVPIVWFMSFVGTILFFSFIIEYSKHTNKFINWFNGKNW